MLLKDMLASLKAIATTTGVPIHWLSWPELMSNRATAENLLEVVNIATKSSRLIWEESLEDLIWKAMRHSVDAGIESANIMGDFQIKLPLVSLNNLKAIMDVWLPLVGDVISMATFRNMLPGIDPETEQKLIEAERKKKAENSPFNNGVVDGILNDMQEGEEKDAE